MRNRALKKSTCFSVMFGLDMLKGIGVVVLFPLKLSGSVNEALFVKEGHAVKRQTLRFVCKSYWDQVPNTFYISKIFSK
jgi:hypothetical protein